MNDRVTGSSETYQNYTIMGKELIRTRQKSTYKLRDQACLNLTNT